MQAIIYTTYGSPDVLQLTEVDKPTPQDNQVLVKIYAASANPLDWHRMRGAPFLARLDGGLRKPKDSRLGADLAGRIEAVGSSVTQFQPGDEVFGCGTGAFAEYVCARETAFANHAAGGVDPAAQSRPARSAAGHESHDAGSDAGDTAARGAPIHGQAPRRRKDQDREVRSCRMDGSKEHAGAPGLWEGIPPAID